jgi:rare lipoprotein A (peptidoglycan hydrolase)
MYRGACKYRRADGRKFGCGPQAPRRGSDDKAASACAGPRDGSSRRSREAGSAGSRCKVTHRYTRRQRQPLRASERSIAHRHRGIVLAARDKSDGARSFSGFASYFSEPQRLATGETYDPSALICAHRTLPLGTKLRVSNPKTGRSVVVTVKDRGPFVHGRVLDLSVSAARALGMIGHGVMLVSASVM